MSDETSDGIGRRDFLKQSALVPLLGAMPGLFSSSALSALAATTAGEVRDAFLAPPDRSRPWAYMLWLDGNISRPGLTADFEAMQRVGMGGAMIMAITADAVEPGPVDFMTPEWLACVNHAVAEANRLGLQIFMNNDDGWGVGGPWITPEQNMQKLVWTETTVRGGGPVSIKLPQPKTKLNYYRDIVVLAVPSPPVSSQPSAPEITREPGEPSYITHHYAQPVEAEAVTVTAWVPGKSPPVPLTWELQVSDDGRSYRTIYSFDRGWRFGIWGIPRSLPLTLSFPKVRARYFRLKVPFSKVLVNTDPVPDWFKEYYGEDRGIEFVLHPSARINLWQHKSGEYNSASYRSAASNDPADGTQITLNRIEGQDPDSVAASAVIAHGDVLDLGARMRPDGQLQASLPRGDWSILRIGHTPTGVQNPGGTKHGLGLEVDKFSAAPVDLHFSKAMATVHAQNRAFVGKSLTHFWSDLWEVNEQNWSPQFAAEFRRRRGYDLMPFLPAMAGGRIVGSLEESERFLWDLRRTMADLIAENHWGRMAELCRQHGIGLAGVGSGAAAFMNDSVLYQSKLDVPSGVFNVGQLPTPACKQAASAAHAYGRKFVGAAAFFASRSTGHPQAGGWAETPYLLKRYGDRAFCHGINRVIMEHFNHNPDPDATLGLSWASAGSNLERTVSWWEASTGWMRYMARCQFLLQEGHFVADAAVLLDEGVPNVLMRPRGLPVGYEYDGIHQSLLDDFRVENGRLVLPSGMSYRLLILPESQRMTPALVRRLKALAEGGAVIVGAKPQASPSLTDYPRADEEVRELAAALWGAGPRQIHEGAIADVLAKLQLAPDFAVVGPADVDIGYVHRRIDGMDVYFLANHQPASVAVTCEFRVSGRAPELWDPDTGKMIGAGTFVQHAHTTQLPLRLEPHGSIFVVFREATVDPAVTAERNGAREQLYGNGLGEETDGIEIVSAKEGLYLATARAGAYQVTTSRGRKLRAKIPELATVTVAGSWTVQFPDGWGAPPKVELGKLISWSEHADEGVRHFSGTATYVTQFDLPRNALGANRRVLIDLGEVKELAELSVNGKPFGVVWKPPFVADISAAVQPGRNQLQIKVTNLWANRIVGDHKLPEQQRYTSSNWSFYTGDSPLIRSGLLGPVVIRSISHVLLA